VPVLAALCGPAAGAGLPWTKVADVPLPGSTARFDYQAVDPSSHRLFISHMGAGTVVVFDLNGRHVTAALDGFPGATGITVDPGAHRAFVSVTGGWLASLAGGGKLAALDTGTLKTVWMVPAGRFPDGSAIAQGKLYVSDESGEQELVFDEASGRKIAAIPLGGEAGMTAFNARDGRIYVNVQTRRELAAIDPHSDGIVAEYPLPADCDNNHGLLIEPSGGRAFIACDGNATLLIFDVADKKMIGHFSTGAEPDVLALDSGRGLLYVAAESGVVSVFDVSAAGAGSKIGEEFAGGNAHSIAVDENTGLVYLPLRDAGGHPVLRIMQFKKP